MAGFQEDHWILSKTLRKVIERKRTVQYINAHHMMNHMSLTSFKSYFQGMSVEELMWNIEVDVGVGRN